MRLPFAALLFSLVLAAPAAAQNLMPRTANEVLNIARTFGTAQFDTPDSDGRPTINGEIDGILYGILLYGCDNPAGCESVQFFASFTGNNNTLEFVNQWNLDKRFATAYVADDGAAVLAYSANIDFGVTRDNFRDSFDIWTILLDQFADRFFGNGGSSGSTAPRATK